MKLFSPLCLLAAALGPELAAGEEPKRAGPDWWSLRKLERPAPPKVRNATWVRNPIDAFVLAKLEAAGLEPAPEADPTTLIRRVTFDLTGLPPTPGEIDGFLREYAAKPQAAYEGLIDRLLASPAYGERWGRHWLDVARFAESNGFEHDKLRDHAWPYRDYVIRSLNEDKPYAKFVAEQLAGDALTPPAGDGAAATGFLVAGPYDEAAYISASATIKARAREDELEELLATVGQTFLGLTVNCARCHDHKFDPIPAADYYRLKAVFDGIGRGNRPALSPEQDRARKEALARHQAKVDGLRQRLDKLEVRGRAKAQPGGDDLPPPLARWAFAGDARDSAGTLHGTLKGGAVIRNGRLVLDGKGAFVETEPLKADLRAKTLEAWVVLAGLTQGGGGVVSVEAAGGSPFDAVVLGERQPGMWAAGSEFFRRTRDLSAPAETTKPGEPVHVAVTYAADGRITVYRNGEPYGESYVPTNDENKPVLFKTGSARLLFGKRHTGGGNAFFAGEIDEARLYDRALSADEVRFSFKAGVERIPLAQILAALPEEERREHGRLEAELAKLRAAAPPSAEPLVYAVVPKQPGPTHLLKRGDPDMKAEEVSPAPPTAVTGPPADFALPASAPEGERRRQFAAWLTHPDNPLTWRVMANRVWHYHFGRGIVGTPNDLGLNGDRPSHPELLDWLAAEFRDGGGKLKALHRLILLSATYRQSARPDAKATAVDGECRLLWRFPPRRLEAEAVRDAMLAVSGTLDRTAGGPGFRPFRVENFNSSFYPLLDGDGPGFNRRSVYRINVNSAKDPLLDVLDCPDPSVKAPRRGITTTPLQALALMNSGFVQRQARAFANRVEREAGPEIGARITLAYRLALGRAPTKEEAMRAAELAKEHGLRPVCWALLNASEFVYIR
jgi:hypothetical protein